MSSLGLHAVRPKAGFASQRTVIIIQVKVLPDTSVVVARQGWYRHRHQDSKPGGRYREIADRLQAAEQQLVVVSLCEGHSEAVL